MDSLQDRLEKQIELMISRPHRYGEAKELELRFCIYLELWEFLASGSEDHAWRELWQRQCARIHPGRRKYNLADVYPYSTDRVRKQIPAAVVEKSRRAVIKYANKLRDELHQSLQSGPARDDRVLIDFLFEHVDRYLEDRALWPTDLESLLESNIDLLIKLIQGENAESFGLRYKSPVGPALHVFIHAKHLPNYPEVENWAGYDQIAKGMKTVFSQLKQHACHKSAVH